MDSYKVFIPYLPIKATPRYAKRAFSKLGLESFTKITFKQHGQGYTNSYYSAIAEFENITKTEWDSFFVHLDWKYNVFIQHKYGKIRLYKFEEKADAISGQSTNL